MDVCEFRLSACFWFWHIKEWKGSFKVFEDLLVDGTIVDIANVNRARTQKIRRVRGKVWWAKRRRKIVR